MSARNAARGNPETNQCPTIDRHISARRPVNPQFSATASLAGRPKIVVEFYWTSAILVAACSKEVKLVVL